MLSPSFSANMSDRDWYDELLEMINITNDNPCVDPNGPCWAQGPCMDGWYEIENPPGQSASYKLRARIDNDKARAQCPKRGQVFLYANTHEELAEKMRIWSLA